jgi:hypothetical protein
MSDATPFSVRWFLADVLGLFSAKVVSFSRNGVPGARIFSVNLVPKRRMFSVPASYVIGPLQVVVSEADSAVALGIPGHTLLDSGHADEEEADVCAVEAVTDVFQGRSGQALGLIDDQ